MRKIQIGDLDGCIADDRWRRHLIATEPVNRGPGWPDKFHGYHEASWRDSCENRQCLLDGVDIVILTARPIRYRALTMAWLAEVAGIDPLHVIFRNNEDYRPSVDVKRQQLGWLLGEYGFNKLDIVQAIDDMEPIVEMYRREGIRAHLVRIGEEQHVHG